ncbi:MULTISPECIES: manganese efflux pump MntP family protein [Gammaproteobacteria]|uniref:manganese efflux pump MntP n=1 Tax=Gammaproteobacteria TaxID=1236 RepID=UPI000BA918FF|nr:MULTISPECIES: manganese efflux pump MntP family protein [Gammaproteobacteria]UJF20348.1 manganese efflux pump MntP family protein [Vibrio sp. SS-MA-C1-2]
MLEVLTLAIALSMDAFAVAVGIGSKNHKSRAKIAFKVALFFGFFQGAMPLIGYLGGSSVLGWIEYYANFVAFILLLIIGGKMLYEAFSHDDDDDDALEKITNKALFTLAIATSIDAMAAGFTLNLLDFQPLLSCVIIGVTTFIFSYIGVYIGNKSSQWIESKAEILGGVVLILLAFKMLFI